jgi:nicotinamide-nucleotide amidase
MRIEALCTGDELLTGVTVDTNSNWFQQRLLEHGSQVARTTIVGDVREEILDALRTISARADVVLVSGGLGPTSDDLTAEVAAQAGGCRWCCTRGRSPRSGSASRCVG